MTRVEAAIATLDRHHARPLVFELNRYRMECSCGLGFIGTATTIADDFAAHVALEMLASYRKAKGAG
jgi:hypothetical protein